jgi:poly-gamma-glutamate capsule biosynthesis protein CapA/YwtB (metallophosphatase superfamily)
MGDRRWLSVGVVIGLLAAGCRGGDGGGPGTTATSSVVTTPAVDPGAVPPLPNALLTVVDENGARLDGAAVLLVGATQPVVLGPTGAVPVNGPTAGVVRLDGYLPEPVVLDPSQPAQQITLFARTGPTGTPRVSLHFAGDMMIGRRYQLPTERADTPIVNTDDDARQVVAAIAPLMAAADASTVNLETVVGALPDEDAYPGKRYLLQSPPAVIAAAQEMGVDLVTLGNNHANDWGEPGVASTLRELTAAGMPFVGAGLTAADAERGVIIPAGALRLGVVSMTTVNGDFVNDSLPGAGVPPPLDLAADDAWQYADRPFGYGAPGDSAYIEQASRRPAEWWQVFAALEPTIDSEQAADLWAALTAPDAVPELQDWVARRGHGGAAGFTTSGMAEQIGALREAGADLVVVQLHGGFQFSEVPSAFLRDASRAAVDAGADLVINHHPHVLQGVEWYDDSLIAYSLGNFVFDQDFASTFPSMFVRTVFEADRLVQARLVPVLLEAYRPLPLTGEGSRRVLQLVDERSALAAASQRASTGRIITQLDRSVTPSASVDIRSGVVLRERPTETLDVTLDAEGFAKLDRCAVVRGAQPDVQYGTELLSWGALTDVTANGAADPAPSFTSRGAAQAVTESGNSFFGLDGSAGNAFVRPVARAAIAQHRRFDENEQPLDDAAKYSLRLGARLAGPGPVIVRTAWYTVDDTDPNVDPESTLLSESETEVPRPGRQWQTITLDLDEAVAALPVQPDAVLVYVVLPRESGTLDVDNLELYEWRQAAPALADQWQAVDALRGAPGTKVQLEASGCVPG